MIITVVKNKKQYKLLKDTVDIIGFRTTGDIEVKEAANSNKQFLLGDLCFSDAKVVELLEHGADYVIAYGFTPHIAVNKVLFKPYFLTNVHWADDHPNMWVLANRLLKFKKVKKATKNKVMQEYAYKDKVHDADGYLIYYESFPDHKSYLKFIQKLKKDRYET